MTAVQGGGYEPYERGKAMGVFINDSSGQPLLGEVRGHLHVVWKLRGHIGDTRESWVLRSW